MKELKLAIDEYIRWLRDVRMILFPCMFIILYSYVTKELLAVADRMKEPINILEPVIGICNSPQLIVLIPVFFLVLISDFPRVDNNVIYKIIRTGRRKWISSQFLFLFLADITYLIFLFVGIVLPVIRKGFWYNGWSNVITGMSEKMPEARYTFVAQLIPPNIYFQMLPYKALAYSFICLSLYLYLIGSLLLAGKIIGHKLAGWIIICVVLLFGSGAAQFGLKIQWLFPAAHGLVYAHFTEYYRRMNFPFIFSVVYFLIFIALCILLVLVRVKHFNYSKIVEMN